MFPLNGPNENTDISIQYLSGVLCSTAVRDTYYPYSAYDHRRLASWWGKDMGILSREGLVDTHMHPFIASRQSHRTREVAQTYVVYLRSEPSRCFRYLLDLRIPRTQLQMDDEEEPA